MLDLPRGYQVFMDALKGEEIFGVVIDDAPIVRDLVRLAWEIRCSGQSPSLTVYRIEDLVLGNLSGTFTFNNNALETGVEFPEGMPRIEQERWCVGWRHSTLFGQLDAIAPGRYTPESHRLLSTQIGARIGDCATYAITLGLLLAVCDLCPNVTLIGKPPHAWVRYQLSGNPPRDADLSERSHGRLDSEKAEKYAADFDDPKTQRIPLPLC